MTLVKRSVKGSPVSAAEYDAVVDQVETNKDSIEVLNGQFKDSQVTLSFANLAAATSYWNTQDGLSNTPTDGVLIYIEDVKEDYKWLASDANKAVATGRNFVETKTTFDKTDNVNNSTDKAVFDGVKSEITDAIDIKVEDNKTVLDIQDAITEIFNGQVNVTGTSSYEVVPTFNLVAGTEYTITTQFGGSLPSGLEFYAAPQSGGTTSIQVFPNTSDFATGVTFTFTPSENSGLRVRTYEAGKLLNITVTSVSGKKSQKIEDIEASITQEAANRQIADTTLQANIDAVDADLQSEKTKIIALETALQFQDTQTTVFDDDVTVTGTSAISVYTDLVENTEYEITITSNDSLPGNGSSPALELYEGLVGTGTNSIQTYPTGTDFVTGVTLTFTASNYNILQVRTYIGGKTLSITIVSNNGKQSVRLENIETSIAQLGNSFKGVEIFSVGDSLATKGIWQNELARLYGATFDNSKNINPAAPISLGGTGTVGLTETCGQYRMKNLIDNHPITKKIFYENINDYNVVAFNSAYIGAINDEPFMLVNVIYLPDQGFTNATAAVNYWDNNIATILNPYTPTKGSSINIPYNTNGINVQVDSGATSSGLIRLTVNGANFEITVTAGDNVADIVDYIMEYQYELNVKARNANNISVDFSHPTTVPTISFTDLGSTGVTMTISATTTAQAYIQRVYKGEANGTDWIDPTKWDFTYTLYSAYKGLIEYVQTNRPTADFYWFIPTRYGLTLSDYHDANGNIDINAFKASQANIDYQSLVDIQIEVCELYGLQYLDMTKLSGITLFNFSTFYNENNVHPKEAGDIRFGETIFKHTK